VCVVSTNFINGCSGREIAASAEFWTRTHGGGGLMLGQGGVACLIMILKNIGVIYVYMGTFAEAEIIDYVSFADLGNKFPFSVSVCSKQTEVCRFRLQIFHVQ
jgi:hypothetical protein